MGRNAKPEYDVKQATYPNSGKYWYIIGRPNGKRTRAWFDTKEAAQAEATERNLKMRKFGESAVTMSGVLANMAIECQTRLQHFNKSLSDATDYYIKHLETINRSVPLNQMTAAVLKEFQRRVQAQEISPRHCKTMRLALRRLEERLGDRASSTITGSEIKSWLSGSTWGTKTRNNLLGYFHIAFAVAIELQLLKENPLLKTKRFSSSKVSKKNNPKFLAVEQLATLLRVADRQIVPYIAICSFAGLRSAECEDLDWKYVDLDRRVITVLENVSKTGEERKPPISDNLAAWLEPYVKAEGSIVSSPSVLEDLLKAAKQKANLWPWRPRYQNALRKSFCSYHYEMHGSADRTSEYAGHDIRMLIKVYRHAVDHSEAVKYWQIFP